MNWSPITPLSPEERAISVSEFDSLDSVWQEARTRLDDGGDSNLAEFKRRLRRSWAVETGILENLFMVNRGATQILVDRGFHQDLVDRASTDTDPVHLVDVLRDHLDASDMIIDRIHEARPITPHFVRELHALITRHQLSAEGVDPLGRAVDAPLLRGQWRTQPSKRRVAAGGEEYYCPPEQIEHQMQDLTDYLALEEEERVSVPILAAWLHHRFTLIHPFQDGNGRVARALVNYLFLKQNLFPVVIDRDEKIAYLDSLESADSGTLTDFARLLASKEVEAIKQALSLADEKPLTSAPASDAAMIRDLARGVVERQQRRRTEERQRFLLVNEVARGLVQAARVHLEEATEGFRDELQTGGIAVKVDTQSGGSVEGTGHYYRWQVIESAKQAGQWANFAEDSEWVRSLIEGSNSRLRFILSFHHVGRALTGVAEVTAFADLEATDSDDPDDRRPVVCMLRPFSFTWEDTVPELQDRFTIWLSECLAVALREWADTL